MTIKPFVPSFISHFSLNLKRKKLVIIRAMRKKLNIFTFQLPIYWMQEISIDTNAGIAKTKQEKHCLCCREVDAMLIASAKIPEHERSIFPSSFYGQLPDY